MRERRATGILTAAVLVVLAFALPLPANALPHSSTGTSPFVVAVNASTGTGTVSLTTTAGDTLILGEYYAFGSPPTDTEHNVWVLVVHSHDTTDAVYNTTAATSGADVVTFTSSFVSHALAWLVEVAHGPTLASGGASGYNLDNPAHPTALTKNAVAVFEAYSNAATDCGSAGGTAWRFACSSGGGASMSAYAVNVSSGFAPTLSTNISTTACAGTYPHSGCDFVWVEIPAVPPPPPPSGGGGILLSTDPPETAYALIGVAFLVVAVVVASLAVRRKG